MRVPTRTLRKINEIPIEWKKLLSPQSDSPFALCAIQGTADSPKPGA
jgi:hypothetical protein